MKHEKHEKYARTGRAQVKLGDGGQLLEEEMAQSVNLQIFSITQVDMDENKGVRASSIDALAREVQDFFMS